MATQQTFNEKKLKEELDQHHQELSQANMLGHVMSERYEAIVRNSKLKTIAIFLLAVGLLLAMLAASSGWSREPEIKYFYLTEDGVAIEVEPLNQPNRSSQVREAFAARSLIDIFDFSYLKVSEHFDRVVADYMTTNGRRALMNAINEVGLIEEMRERYEISTLTPTGSATLFAEGVHPDLNVYVWSYHMPIRLRLEGPEGVRYKSAVARFSLVRVPPHVHVRGLLINNIQLLPPTEARRLLNESRER